MINSWKGVVLEMVKTKSLASKFGGRWKGSNPGLLEFKHQVFIASNSFNTHPS